MEKYDPLREYLDHQSGADILPTFRQIEKIIHTALPNSVMNSWRWTPATTRVDAEAWQSAGFDAQLHAGQRMQLHAGQRMKCTRITDGIPRAGSAPIALT
jgi:hypothetical protein